MRPAKGRERGGRAPGRWLIEAGLQRLGPAFVIAWCFIRVLVGAKAVPAFRMGLR
jgi:hypothetical protein